MMRNIPEERRPPHEIFLLPEEKFLAANKRSYTTFAEI
jgi:hypothetical protein